MMSKKNIAIILAFLLGQIAPLIFISLDIGELSLDWSLRNAIDVYQSQKIYLFTSIAFPLFLSFIFLQYLSIQKQKAFYQSILDEAQEMVVVVDHLYRPIYQNAAFKSFGFREGLADIIDGREFPVAFEFEREIGNEHKYLLCSATHSVVRNEFTLIFRDITTLRENADKIKQQEESILRSRQLASLGEISSGIAHEINNPLGVIIGNTDILRDHIESPSATALKCLDTIDRMGMRITGIIKAMKNLSRKSDIDVAERVDLELVLSDISNLSMINLKNSGTELRLDLASFRNKIILGSSVQISQVFLNLIGNATQAVATLDERWVRITCVEDNFFYRIQVQNSGPQIPKEIQDKIFQPFFTTKGPGNGTGLGLSLSRTIVDVHKGTLQLDGENDHPTFIMTLPKP